MKPRITMDADHQQEHDHDKAMTKKATPAKAKAMNAKVQKVSAKAHRKSMAR